MSPGLVDRFLPVAIGAALLIALHQLVDVYGAMAGLDLATAAGRMGLVNTVAARLPAFIVADVLLVLAAVRAADRRLRFLLVIVHFGLGLTALALLPEYLADAAGITAGVRPAELLAYRVLVVRVAVILLVGGAGGLLLGWRLRRAGSR
ncbi:MAG TPA: hypothetical protein VFN96_10030 [Gemmatimonadales bacterium]|nr:hypothetical protein [Gemmatimonadales bacterium]